MDLCVHGRKALLASVEGRIATRPSMEESLPPQDTLVVERFIRLSPQGSCGGTTGNHALRGAARTGDWCASARRR